MSSTSNTANNSNNNKRDLGEEYGADIQLLEGMPTKIRRLTYENDLLRQERAKDKLQLTAKDSVIAILIASLKDSGAAPAPAPAPAPSVPQQPVAAVSTGSTSTRRFIPQTSILAPLSPVKPAATKVVHAATSPMPAAAAPVVVAAPVAAAVPAKTSATSQQQRPPTTTPVAAATKTKSSAAVPAAAAKPVAPAVPVVAATAAPAKKSAAAAPTPVAPKPLKLQHPAVAVPEVDDCSEYGEEEEEEEVAVPAPAAAPAPVEQQLEEEDDGVEDQDEEEEEDEVQVVSVKYSPSKLPKDFFYVASTQKLYRIKYDEDGDQEVGEMVATYDLATKRITERFVATL